jgi:hypothetical protein
MTLRKQIAVEPLALVFCDSLQSSMRIAFDIVADRF